MLNHLGEQLARGDRVTSLNVEKSAGGPMDSRPSPQASRRFGWMPDFQFGSTSGGTFESRSAC